MYRLWRIVSVGMIGGLLSGVLLSQPTYAQANTWSGAASANVSIVNQGDTDWQAWHMPHCTPSVAIVEDYTDRELRDICYVEDRTSLKLAVYRRGDTTYYALKRANDAVFHRIEQLMADPANLVLLKDGSLLGASMSSSDVLAMYSLHEIASKLVEVRISQSELAYHKIYTIQMQAADIFTDGEGHTIPVEYIGVSKNERFAITQVLGRGPARIDLTTRKVTLIANTPHVDHAEVAAISNDGRSAIIANGTTQKVYTGIDICGSHDTLAYIRNSGQCYVIDISSQIRTRVTGGLFYNPAFTDNTSIVVSALDPARSQAYQVVVTPGIPRLTYLALGDSYSSGEGDIDKRANGSSYYIPGTEGTDKCHLSNRSYPYLLGNYLKVSSERMRSVACSGARVFPDYYGGAYNGQRNELSGKTEQQKTAIKEKALRDFTPGLLHQIDFVATYKPEMVTFTGGGNDIGFARIIEYCASSYKLFGVAPINETCAYASNKQMLADLNGSIDSQYYHNRQFIEKIKEVSPGTKIYMVGYPQFVANGWSCLQQSPILNGQERKMLRASVSRLNNVLKKVARDTDVYYIDIEDSLSGGQICEGSKYMTGPVRTIAHNLSLRKDSNMYHPNAEGHKKIARAIYDKYKTGMDYDVIEGTSDTGTTRRLVRTPVMPSEVTVGSTGLITMNPGMFKSNGEVTIEMFSQATKLGTVAADRDGAVRMTYKIPRSVGIGMHLLTLTGYDEENKPIQVQQFVRVTNDVPGDADGDGIPDEDDPCYGVTEWYIGDVDTCVVRTKAPTASASGIFTYASQESQEGKGDNTMSEITTPTAIVNRPYIQGASRAMPSKEFSWQWLIIFGVITILGGGVYGAAKKRKT